MGQRVWSRDEARSARTSHGQEVTGFGDGLLWRPPPLGNDRNAPGDTAGRAGEGVLWTDAFHLLPLAVLVLGMGFTP